MLLAVQRLRTMSNGGSLLAKWTIGFYVTTTLCSIVLSCIMVSLVWEPMFVKVDDEQLKLDSTDTTLPDTKERPIHTVVIDMFR